MDIDEAIEEVESGALRFDRLVNICTQVFGEPRTNASHVIFRTPWAGDPRVNLQRGKDGKAKPYQVRQVLNALRRLKGSESG